MKKRIIWFLQGISMLVAGAIAFLTLIEGYPEVDAEKKALSEAEIGDVVTFGNYNSNTEWIVLDKQNNKILLISKNSLEKRQYNDTYGAITWEECSIRKWLNEDYYTEAFNAAERNAIESTPFEISEDNIVWDKVFLLTVDEVNTYFPDREARDACYLNGEESWWWTRLPMTPFRNASYNDYGGYLYYSGSHYIDGYGGVRPALWINVS